MTMEELWTPYLVCRWRRRQSGWFWSKAKTAMAPPVDEDNFDVAADDDTATASAANQVVSAILGTQESAAQGGYQLTSTGVTWTASLPASSAKHKALTPGS